MDVSQGIASTGTLPLRLSVNWVGSVLLICGLGSARLSWLRERIRGWILSDRLTSETEFEPANAEGPVAVFTTLVSDHTAQF